MINTKTSKTINKLILTGVLKPPFKSYIMWKQYKTTIKYHEIELTVQYSYSKGEERTHDYPGSPDVYEIDDIWIESTNIVDLLSDVQLDEIENLIEEAMEDYRDQQE